MIYNSTTYNYHILIIALFFEKRPVLSTRYSSIQRVVYKTWALLLLATDWRIRENVALTKVSRPMVTASRMVNRFAAKIPQRSFFNRIPRIFRKNTDIQERLRCPVRAWDYYYIKRRVSSNSANPSRLWPTSSDNPTLEFKKLLKEPRSSVQ